MPDSLPDCVVFRGGIAYIFLKATVIQKQSVYPRLVAKKKRNIRKVLREDDVDFPIHTQSGQPLQYSSRMEPTTVDSFIMRSLGHLTTTPVYNFLRLIVFGTTLHFAMQERSVVDPLASYWRH